MLVEECSWCGNVSPMRSLIEVGEPCSERCKLHNAAEALEDMGFECAEVQATEVVVAGVRPLADTLRDVRAELAQLPGAYEADFDGWKLVVKVA